MCGSETPKDETLTTPHPCSCLSPVSTLIPGKFHIPSATPGSICSHALWLAPPAPLGSWCPESGNFPGLGEIRGALPSRSDGRPDGSAGSVGGEAAAARGQAQGGTGGLVSVTWRGHLPLPPWKRAPSPANRKLLLHGQWGGQAFRRPSSFHLPEEVVQGMGPGLGHQQPVFLMSVGGGAQG